MADVLSIPMPFEALSATRVRIIDADKIHHCLSSDSAVSWAHAMQRPSLMIRNWSTPIGLLQHDDRYFPLGIGAIDHRQTYISAPCNGYIGYAQDELDQITDTRTRKLAAIMLTLVAPWMRALKLDRAICVNAYGVSTQLYPNWPTQVIDDITQELCQHYPDRPLWIRTLNDHSDNALMNKLIASGWHLWPNRQVYIFDAKHAADWGSRRNNQLDSKLIRTTSLAFITHHDFTLEDCVQMERLYKQLYMDKHSHWNADYTAHYFEEALQHRWCEFIGYRDEQGELVAFIGIYADHKTMTTPMLGYDTTLPQTLGLYRLLMGRVMRLAFERELILNLGAGASSFKKMRGGEATIEWHAFYCAHLPIWQRIKMRLTAWLMRKTVPSFLSSQGL